MSTSQVNTSKTKVIDFPVIQVNQSYLIQLSTTFRKCEAEAFRQKFEQLCQSRSNHICIVIDCSKVSSIDSQGLNILISSSKLAHKQEFKVVFWSVTNQIRVALFSASLDCLLSPVPGISSDKLNIS